MMPVFRFSLAPRGAPTLAALRRRAGVLLAVALGWLACVLAIYYTQLWRFLLKGEWVRPDFHGERTLPYLGEALSRTISGVAGAASLLVGAILVGYAISRAVRWRYSHWREAVSFSAALGIGTFAYAGLGLAAFGLYRVEVVRVLAMLPLLGGLGWWLKCGRPMPRWRWPGATLRWRVEWLWMACAVLAVGFAFVAALAPEHEFDALWYHLAYPRLYLEHGSLVDVPTDYVSLYPMTWELWFGYGLAFGGQTAATLLHFACLILTALMTFELTRRFVPGASPWLAVALFATVPTVMWEASTAHLDLALAFHVTLTIYATLRYADGRQWQWLLLTACNLGLAMATKHLALIVFGLTCTGLVLRLWKTERNLWRALWPALLLGGLSLLFPLPWYLRSALASGNPVFPELYAVFGAPPGRLDAVTAQGLKHFLEHFGPPRTLFNLLTLPWHMTIHAAAYDGALGPLFLILLPVLLIARWRRALPWLGAFVLFFIGIWASPWSSFQMRFLVPITPFLAALGAAAFGRLRGLARLAAHRRGAALLAGAGAFLLMLNLPPFIQFHEHDRVEWEGWLNSVLHGVPLEGVIGAESREAYLTRTIRSYAVWNFANRALPDDARVLTWSNGEQFYTRPDRIWAMSAAANDVAWAGPGQDDHVLRGLHDLGVTHLIVDRNTPKFPEEWNQYTLTGLVARASWYETLYADSHYTLYRLRWEKLDAQLAKAPPAPDSEKPPDSPLVRFLKLVYRWRNFGFVWLLCGGLLAYGWRGQVRSAMAALIRPSTIKRQWVFWSMWGVFFLAAALRLYLEWQWNRSVPDSPQRLWADEPGYDSLARGLLRGYGFTWPGRVPLYPLWLAGIYVVAHGSYAAVTYMQLWLGVAAVLLTYALGRRVFGHTAGLIGACLAAVSYVLIWESFHLLSEALYTPVILMAALAFWDAAQAPTLKRFAWAGFWIGVSNLVRPTLFLFPFAALVVLWILLGWRRALRYGGVLVLAAMLVVMPWMVRNYLKYSAVYPLATSHAILWQGSPEYYHLLHDQGYSYLDIWEKVLYGPSNEGHEPGTVEGDRWWTQRALRSIAAEPLIYLKYAVEKLGTYWVGDPYADWAGTWVFNYQALRGLGLSHLVAVQYLIARVLPIIALLALVTTWRRWRTLLPISALLVYNTLLHAATHAEARLSEPLQPFLLIMIGGAALTLAEAAAKRIRLSRLRFAGAGEGNITTTG